MSAHTPGPWHFTDDYNTHVIRSQPKEGREYGELLASIWGGRHEANARLIAAAPTMYSYIASSASNGCAEAAKIMEAIYGSR